MAFKDGFRTFPALTTKRLLHGELAAADAAAMLREMRSFPENTSWAEGWAAQWLEHARARIQHHRKAFARKQNIHWAVRKLKGKAIIGVCKLFEFECQSKAEIGYWTARRLWSQGFATEAVRAVVESGFGVLGLHRIYARTDVTDVPSQRVLEKAGFRKEGVLRKDARRVGVWRDSLICGLLNDDAGRRPASGARQFPPSTQFVVRPSGSLRRHPSGTKGR